MNDYFEGKVSLILFQKEKSLVGDAAYFMKFALGSYGWPLYMFMNPCSGPWNLCGGMRYYVDNYFKTIIKI